MAETKYDKIYRDLKKKIENGTYSFQELLPSEHMLTEEFGCARNTIRRAVAQLSAEGYVQSMHGKGVRVIYQPRQLSQYSLGRVESFKEVSKHNRQNTRTEVVHLSEQTVDESLHEQTLFPVGMEVYYVQRVRYLEGKALIIDHNYFSREFVPGLTKEICERSIYDYIENTLHRDIVTTKRMVTVERVTPLDSRYLELDNCSCVAVVSNSTYNADGIMFEFTQSRHHPDYFVFYDQARRLKR